jgi:hypothetical protein
VNPLGDNTDTEKEYTETLINRSREVCCNVAVKVYAINWKVAASRAGEGEIFFFFQFA